MERGSRTKKHTDSVKSPETLERCPLSVLPVKPRIHILAIVFFTFIGFACYAWYSYAKFMYTDRQYHRAIELDGIITHLDEVLTMSAQMAAATNDLSWEERYRNFKPKLDAAIKEATLLDLKLPLVARPIVQTDAANIKLVAMENEAFDLIHNGNHQAALTLLQNQEYKKQKDVYRQTMRHRISALREHAKGSADVHRHTTLGVIAFVGFLLLATTYVGTITPQLRKRSSVCKQAQRLALGKVLTTNNELKQMQSQIIQSEKLASIGQLAAGVAHEMNTPVGFVASNFEALESYVEKIKELLGMYGEIANDIEAAQEADLIGKAKVIGERRAAMNIDFILEDIQGIFDDSREGLARVTDIVQNLRDFSRIDQPGSLDQYDLNRGLEATLAVAKNELKYNVDIKTEFSKVPATCCNSGQINQVLLNILINAAQAIRSQEREDRGSLILRTYATDTEIVCEISDDGPGISADHQAKIFDPFFTTKPVGEGTGLGLSVSYDIIVRKHKGKLLVESEVGKGTKFTIKLPITGKESSDRKEIESNGQTNSTICG